MTPPGQILSARDVAARVKRLFTTPPVFPTFPVWLFGLAAALVVFFGRKSDGTRNKKNNQIFIFFRVGLKHTHLEYSLIKYLSRL